MLKPALQVPVPPVPQVPPVPGHLLRPGPAPQGRCRRLGLAVLGAWKERLRRFWGRGWGRRGERPRAPRREDKELVGLATELRNLMDEAQEDENERRERPTEEALMKLLKMMRSASDESQLRDAIKEARRADLPPTDIEQAQDALNEMIVARELKALRDAMESGDEIQLRDAVLEASKVDVPAEELEKARDFLSRMKLQRYVDVLEKAMDSENEDQLREAISAARKAVPNDDAQIVPFQKALGEAQGALKDILLAKELRQLQDAVASGDEELLREALNQGRAMDLPESECAKAQEVLNGLVVARKLKFLRSAADSADQERLREAISQARKDGLPAAELDKANDALSLLIRERDVEKLQEAVASEDEELLRRAILDAKQLEVPKDEVANAQLALEDLVQKRSIRQVELAISSSDESELKDAISEARKAGVAGEVIDKAKETLKQTAVAKASKYLEDAQVSQDEDRLRDAIIEARQLDVPQKDVERAQGVLNTLVLERRTEELRRAVDRRDEAELRDAVRAARRRELPEEEIEKATATLTEVVMLRKLSWLENAMVQKDENELRQLLQELRGRAASEAEGTELQNQIEEALSEGQRALTALVLQREVDSLAVAARSGSEARLREALDQAKEANVAPENLEDAMETLNQLTCQRLRSELQVALSSDNEAEIREILKEARAMLPLEELEEANEKLEILQLLRELAEASRSSSLRAALQRAESLELLHPTVEVAQRKLAAVEKLREAEQSADPTAIETALAQAKRLRVDPDLISSAEGILDREMGIRRFGLKHGVVIQERAGQALPIPFQERFRSQDIFFLLLDVFRSRTLQQVALPVMICTMWAALLAAIFRQHHLADGAWRLNQFLVTPLGLLLTFRTQQSITRFNGAVESWSKISSACRSLSRALFYQDARIPLAVHEELVRNICLFPEVLREHLENRRTNLLEIRRDDVSKPMALLDRIQRSILGLRLESAERSALLKLVEQLSDLVSPCEMIVQTPVPQSYVRHTGRFLAVWLLSLPLSLASESSWLIVLIELLASWCLFAIQEIGLRLEDPFNGQITMHIFIKTVKKEVRQRYVLLVEELLRAYAEGQLEAMEVWSHRFDAKLVEVLEDEQRLATDEMRRAALNAVEDFVKR